MIHKILQLSAIIFCLALVIKAQEATRYGVDFGWLKGNTHTHVDERTDPTTAITNYHDNNYDFVVMTEHRSWFDETSVNIPNRRDDLLIISGEEFHSNVTGSGAHTTVMNTTAQLGDLGETTATWSEFWNAVGELAASFNGNIMLNHPYWGTGLTAEEMNNINSTNLFEMFNGAQDASFDNYGIVTTGVPMEQRWDDVLSLGGKWYGIGSDDAHEFAGLGTVNPFSAWSMIRSTELSYESIWQAFVQGDFYATNGVILKSLSTENGLINIEVDTASTLFEILTRDTLQWDNPSAPEEDLEAGYQIQFIGQDGAVLKTVSGTSGEYQVTQNDPYVRANVTYTRVIPESAAPRAWGDVDTYIADNNITRETYFAWVQPVFTDARHEGGPAVFGCTDTGYIEYDATANLHDPAACITSSIQIKKRPVDIFNNENGFLVRVAPEFGHYAIEVRNVKGALVKSLVPNHGRRHNIGGLKAYATYFILVKGSDNLISTKVVMNGTGPVR